jgi:hypothetical protein
MIQNDSTLVDTEPGRRGDVKTLDSQGREQVGVQGLECHWETSAMWAAPCQPGVSLNAVFACTAVAPSPADADGV